MKLFLCSDYTCTARFMSKFFDLSEPHKCLFVGYANEDKDFSVNDSSAADILKDQNFELVALDENYKFDEKIDLIFVRGGNTTQLIHYLKKYNQFEKLKKMAESGVVFAGQSAGAILAGADTEYTLVAEPYGVDLKKLYGTDALKGYGFVDKMIFVHASKYRMCRKGEMAEGEQPFRTLDTDCYPAYRKDLKRFSKDEFIRIGNNQVYLVDGGKKRILTFDWSKIPVKK